jgi:hypothetical protein
MNDDLLNRTTADLRRPPPEELERRLMVLLGADQPVPGPGFDERLLDRLEAQRLVERVTREEAAAPDVLEPRLDALLDLDAPQPSATFDESFSFRFRRLRAEDNESRVPPVDLLRVPALPNRDHGFSTLPRLGRPPFTNRHAFLVGLGAVAALFVLYLLKDDTVVDPPDDQLQMVAHLDLLESLDEVEHLDVLSTSSSRAADPNVLVVARLDPVVLEAADDEELFDLVAHLDELEAMP